MKRALIISGGSIDYDFALDFLIEENYITEEYRKAKACCWIAADRGLEFCRRAGLIPDIVVGDFDSMPKACALFLEEQPDLRVIRLVPEKDDSDTQSALNHAILEGAEEVLILGATGSRLDHVFANLELLVYGKTRNVRVSIVDKYNRISLAENRMTITDQSRFGKYLSFFPMGGDVTGLTLTGFKYPLYNHTLRTIDTGLTVSNELLEETAVVEFSAGVLLMIESRD
ncbi:MAG: thiamine diphosphokinase [Blautia sp.]|nr:thiamine diphosphokinase [Blautia sp.]